ncbi:type IV pilus biogenesis/stability protein PilW [Lacimicrobium alkaliphilum]|uniref:LysM domain-containing protein n=1 Tax=Lacimicrobium alkaliphilum TaxID=1526571 RepID=A0A0U2QNX8_9ALTE|nr:type IV pilus biogenesis/stability protein PilW [Lacimicrobium alkaliphilum]ALS99339.1 hypothetical protein AT746_14460 [Lacimicrobium alkaliphilum]
MQKLLLISICLLISACAGQSGQERANNFDAAEAAKTRISLGLTYLKNGNFSQAKRNLDKALEFAPKMADVHYSLAYYFQRVEEFEQAEKSYRQAMQLDRNNPDILNSYGAFLCQLGRYDQAKGYFMQAVNSQSYNRVAETYENMALCSRSQGQISDAVDYLERALNHQPGRSQSLLLLTEILIEDEQWQQAKQALSRYERQGRVTPQTLYMAYQAESGLQNLQGARGYVNMLMQLYPEHRLTARAQQSLRAQSRVERAEPVATPVPAPTPKTEDREVTDEEQGVQFHEVQAGENLYRISLKYNIRMSKLIEWNELADAQDIRVGSKLRVSQP